jgi:hypothetical protein
LALLVNRSLSERNRDAMDDDGLIVRLAAGDDTVLRELSSRHAPWLAARLRVVLPGNGVPALAPGSPYDDAAKRFAALPAAARHAWLVAHLTALRAGRITLSELP